MKPIKRTPKVCVSSAEETTGMSMCAVPLEVMRMEVYSVGGLVVVVVVVTNSVVLARRAFLDAEEDGGDGDGSGGA